MKKTWMGSTKCDFCGREIADTLVDGVTTGGAWAVMCPRCFKIHGVGLGTGCGQQYKKDNSGEFVKVEKKRKVSSQRAAMIQVAMDMGLTREEAEMEVADFLG